MASKVEKVRATFALLPHDNLHTNHKQNASLHEVLGSTLLLSFASGSLSVIRGQTAILGADCANERTRGSQALSRNPKL